MIKSITAIVILFCMCLTGCNSLGTADTIYDSSSPAARIRDCLDSGNSTAAELIWFENRASISAHSSQYHDLSQRLAEAVTPYFNSTLKNDLEYLESINLPISRNAWSSTRNKLENISVFIDHSQNSVISSKPWFTTELKRLENKYLKFISRLRSEASEHFVRYDIFRDADFFEVYPAALNGTEFLSKKSNFLIKKISRSSVPEAAFFNKVYGKYLAPELRWILAQNFYESLSAGSKYDSEFKRNLRAVLDFHKAGFTDEQLPMEAAATSINFVRVTSRTLIDEHRLDFGLNINCNLPFKTVKLPAESFFEDGSASGSNIVVLINELVTRIDRRTSSYMKVNSSYISGYDEEVNPEYKKIKIRYDEVREHISDMQDTAQVNSLMGLGGAIANIGVMSDLGSLKDESEQLRQKLSGTPEKVRHPVLSPYSYSLVTVNDLKLSTIAYYIIDKSARTVFKGTFDVRRMESFKVPYGLSTNDPHKKSILQGRSAEQDIEGFENSNVEVRLSEILNAYLSGSGETEKYRGASYLGKQIFSERNKALEESSNHDFSVDTAADPRFDCVVAINRAGGGMGAGFYVTDDTVLTSFHVVEGHSFVELLLHNGLETFGKVTAFDAERDLALIKVQARGNPVQFYGGRKLPSGVELYAIGHPRGLKFSMSKGILSAIREMKGTGVIGNRSMLFIQTDADIYPGNSGGPLFLGNAVVGMNSFKRSDMGGAGFAVHYSEIMDFMDQYKVHYLKGAAK